VKHGHGPVSSPDREDERFMRQALELARKGLHAGELPIGTVLVLDGRILARAYCADKGERKLHHPELLVLLEGDRRHHDLPERRRMTLYTNLEPCLMCFGAATSCCIGRIVYGLGAPVDGALARIAESSFCTIIDPEYIRPVVVGGVLKPESRALFKAFVAQSIDEHMMSFAARILAADDPGPHAVGL